MIATLDDLVAFSHRSALACPELASRLVINRPGCSQADIAAITTALPGLPNSYLSVAKSLNLDGVSIGYFELSPSSSHQKGLVEQLIEWNDPSITPMASRYRTHGVYQVASWEADPIAVAQTSTTFNVGQVVKYNAGNPDARPTVLADDFEQFLLLAGTLDEIRDKHGDDPAQAMNEFSTYLSPIVSGRKDDMASTWKTIAEVVLS